MLQDLTKKRSGERKKNDRRCYARLCEKADSLKALGSVARFLRNSKFYLINDIPSHVFQREGLASRRFSEISPQYTPKAMAPSDAGTRLASSDGIDGGQPVASKNMRVVRVVAGSYLD